MCQNAVLCGNGLTQEALRLDLVVYRDTANQYQTELNMQSNLGSTISTYLKMTKIATYEQTRGA